MRPCTAIDYNGGMKFSGSRLIPATRVQVWEALNDPEILQRIVPGAQSIERVREDEFHVASKMKIGPVSASFQGRMLLSDVVPARSCTISGEGKGVAGFAKGSAQVQLQDAENGHTLLTYSVQSAVGGKLAQIGQRFLDATATRMTEEFFTGLSESLAPADSSSVPDSEVKSGKHPVPWSSKLIIAGAVLVILSLFAYLIAV